jgi:pimeloyl-ACP methyl ester carboxylesterase
MFARAALALVCLASCVDTRIAPRPLDLPQDLDRYLESAEAAVPGVIQGDRKEILWAGPRGRRTPLSIVYLHGWQGSRREYASVFDPLAEELGANIYYARLRGFCTTTEEITRVTLDDWIHDAREAMEIGRRIGDRVVLAGSSMGGDLALWIATHESDGLAGLVLLSCAVQPRDRRSEMLLWPWPLRVLILRIASGEHNPMELSKDLYPTGNPELFARFNPPRYRSESTLKLMAVVKLVRGLPLESVSVPSLWLYSEKDDAVDVSAIKAFHARAGGNKTLLAVEGARAHMLAGDMFSPETTPFVIGAVRAFLRP